jgi:hypothetical protein
MSDDKVAAVKAKVQRPLDTNVIRKVKYPTWLANTVPVKKKNRKWLARRMIFHFPESTEWSMMQLTVSSCPFGTVFLDIIKIG